MRDGEPNIYGALATLRSGQTQVQWSRIQMVVVFNAVALALVLGTGQLSEEVRLTIGIVGFAIHFGVLIASRRGDRWIQYWDGRMVELEQLDQEEGNTSGSRVSVFNRPDFSQMRGVGLTSRRVFGVVGIIATILWLGIPLYYAYKILFE